MGHRFAIGLVVGLIGGIILLDVILDFLLAQFGIWFALPASLLIFGFIYWVVYHSSEQWRKEAEG